LVDESGYTKFRSGKIALSPRTGRDGKLLNKSDAAKALEEIAVLLELTGANSFKTRAYTNAARALERVTGDLDALIESGELKQVKGIGKSIFEKIIELAETGHSAYIDELHANVPDGLLEILHIPGFGPKRTRIVNQKLGITTIDELQQACEQERLRELEGFGEKIEENVLEGIQFIKRHRGRILYWEAWPEACVLLERIRSCAETVRAELAGSIRRGKETVKDVDIVAAVTDSGPVMEAFTTADDVAATIAKGETKSSIVLHSGLAADLRTVTPEQFPYALHHFTGSADHNVAMRGRAQQKFGIKINEYGLFKSDKLIPVEGEEGFFRELGLAYIEPELRENTGEIEAAETDSLPRLVTKKDIKGVIHVHTTASDGHDSLEDMIDGAIASGYEYIGINDHSQAAAYAGGLSEDELLAQIRQIDELNSKLDNFRILKSVECDILADGDLDYSPKVLERLDYVIISVHSNFNQTRERMTRRIINAIKSPHASILGHPTGALLLQRKSYELDLDEIIRVAAVENVALELNAGPNRLDLDWPHCKAAKEAGTAVVIGVDAHSVASMEWMDLGISIARKGWLEPENILNCLNAEKFLKFFQA